MMCLEGKNNKISSSGSNICSVRKKWSHVSDTKTSSLRSIKKREKNLMTNVSKKDERYKRTGMDALRVPLLLPSLWYCIMMHTTFWHSCSQKELEEGVFANQKICRVAVLKLS